MTDLTYSPAAVSRLLNAVLHPETVEGYERPTARLDAIAAAFVWATTEEREALIEEAAELLTLDPDAPYMIDTPPVSEQDDERNSRPFPL
jgi:hypothetical protein